MSKDSYLINIHYPETETEMLELRKRLGDAYIQFVKDYVLNLNITNEEKNILYVNITKRLFKTKC
jgi:hypothetical protein